MVRPEQEAGQEGHTWIAVKGLGDSLDVGCEGRESPG